MISKGGKNRRATNCRPVLLMSVTAKMGKDKNSNYNKGNIGQLF